MYTRQHTIKQPVSLTGQGLHTGQPSRITFHPAPADHGFVFCRADVEGRPLVHADVDLVVETARGTTLAENGVRVYTVEHVLSALAGLQIDNVLIELEGPEPPIMDGSAQPFVELLLSSGMEEQDAAREIYVIDEPIYYREPDRKVELAVFPADTFQATVMVDFDAHTLRAQQAFLSALEDYPGEIADSRTFCFLHEVEAMHAAGLIQGGNLDSAVVVVDRDLSPAELDRLRTTFGRPDLEVKTGLLNADGFRHANEPARHKLLDIVGDLALIGTPIKGSVLASRPGHKANVELAKKIKSRIKQSRIAARFQKGGRQQGLVFDINAIHNILPHRYPFLLVDKIVDFSESKIVGIKNVTINEPFFQGHFPGNPIMPGVLQLEAMAQVGGVLLLNSIENPQSIWVYIVGIDNARFKKPVIPGDVLVMELELTALRRGICKMSGRVLVDGQVVCTADLVASVVPKT
ncbi:MAG: bifunctional UDP-3-O-[3-hydroxymyristoyl] N-acetylglucosamine deacetylase/3-hydroxyacyl-ACP dehydratase [Bacteroidia bacterium]|nr:bifunctional UDP-3-O-[3-hydroxymyristoyl] N-acetylglucosamine deacetylase/3-hydroxyacyl-ACP dehydratase [Bacteroidia bacterium]